MIRAKESVGRDGRSTALSCFALQRRKGSRPPLTLASGARAIHEDSEEPCLERRASFEAIDSLNHRKPSVLDDLVGDRARAGVDHRHAHEGSLVVTDHPDERGFVATPERRNEFSVVVEERVRNRHGGRGMSCERMQIKNISTQV
jgi:hypothetical protein